MTDPATEWDAEAPMFDEAADHGLRDPAVRDAWRELLDPVVGEPARRVADLGCGTGSLSLLLAEAGHEVAGVDVAPAMVALARDKCAHVRPRPTFVVGDAADPPLPQARFDVVLSRHVLWAMSDLATALARWIELLDTDGVLVLIEGRWHTGAGLTARQTTELLTGHGRTSTVTPLTDPQLWGRPIEDERYLCVSRASASP